MNILYNLVFRSMLYAGVLMSVHSRAQPELKLPGTLLGVFDGRTPCQELAAQIREKTTPECIKIKWRLTLYEDSPGSGSGSYELLGFVFKRDSPGTGRWQSVRGTSSNPEAIVYQLHLAGRPPLYLLKGDENVLFFLDQDKNLMVGNRDFSYTLNRISKQQ